MYGTPEITLPEGKRFAYYGDLLDGTPYQTTANGAVLRKNQGDPPGSGPIVVIDVEPFDFLRWSGRTLVQVGGVNSHLATWKDIKEVVKDHPGVIQIRIGNGEWSAPNLHFDRPDDFIMEVRPTPETPDEFQPKAPVYSESKEPKYTMTKKASPLSFDGRWFG